MEDQEPGPSRRNVVYRHIRFQIGPYETPPRQKNQPVGPPEHAAIDIDDDSASPPILSHFAGEEAHDEIVEGDDGIEILEEEVIHPSQSYSYEDEIEDEDNSVMAIEQGLSQPKLPYNNIRMSALSSRKMLKDPRKTYPRCYVEPSRRWTYKSESQPILNDGELYYAPDPFRPVPPTKNGPCAAVRMHYAAQRIDSVKYRNQQSVANAAKRGNMESASCEKCNMRFFLPYSDMRARISYSQNPTNRYNLPTAFFRCPICRHQNQIIEYA